MTTLPRSLNESIHSFIHHVGGAQFLCARSVQLTNACRLTCAAGGAQKRGNVQWAPCELRHLDEYSSSRGHLHLQGGHEQTLTHYPPFVCVLTSCAHGWMFLCHRKNKNRGCHHRQLMPTVADVCFCFFCPGWRSLLAHARVLHPW